MRHFSFTCLFVLSSLPILATGQTTVIPANAEWKYYDSGEITGAAWKDASFDDSPWQSGKAELGYGDSDEATKLNYGGDTKNKRPSVYFRKTVTVPATVSFNSVRIIVKYDDGMVMYLDGSELFRKNMPSGDVSYSTWASEARKDEKKYDTLSFPISSLTPGSHTFAASVHQSSATSSDLSFKLSLDLLEQANDDLIRGPYLQLTTDTSAVIKWRTKSTSNTIVRYGPSPDSLIDSVDAEFTSTEHEAMITGLKPLTKYYYSIHSGGVRLKGNTGNYFYTHPKPGSYKQTRVWIIGDAGTGNDKARSVRDAYYSYMKDRHTDVWLMLGDNAYNTGKDSEHQKAIFENMYEKMLQITPAWPTIGNHERMGSTNSANQTGTHFDIWTLPKKAEAGGLASGTEAYYSFDYGRVHFVNINSTIDIIDDATHLKSMMDWIKADLEETTQDWIIAYWHHPPYTKGTHNSDKEKQLEKVRETFLPVLEEQGVDLVLTGHSHGYERSYLINGHYGNSSTFKESMKLDSGNGKDKPYEKTIKGKKGAIYTVAGSSGKLGGGAYNHPAMHISLQRLGSMVLDVGPMKLDAVFLTEKGEVKDEFSLVKTDIDTSGFISVSEKKTPLISNTVGHMEQVYPMEGYLSVAISARGHYSLELISPDGTVVLKKIDSQPGVHHIRKSRLARGVHYFRLVYSIDGIRKSEVLPIAP